MRCEGFRECDRPIQGICRSCGRPLCRRHISGTSCGQKSARLHHMEDNPAFHEMTCQSCKVKYHGVISSKRCPTCARRHKEEVYFAADVEHHRKTGPVRGGWK